MIYKKNNSYWNKSILGQISLLIYFDQEFWSCATPEGIWENNKDLTLEISIIGKQGREGGS